MHAVGECGDVENFARTLRDQHIVWRDASMFGEYFFQFADRGELIFVVLIPVRHDRRFRFGRHSERVLVERESDWTRRASCGRHFAFKRDVVDGSVELGECV